MVEENYRGNEEDQITGHDRKLVSYLAGENDDLCSEKEHEDFQELDHTWELSGLHYSYAHTDSDRAWELMQRRINQKDSLVRRLVPFIRYAALIIVTLGIGWTIYSGVQSRISKAPVNDIAFIEKSTIARPVRITSLTLPDGTEVKMNAGTTLKYPARFGKGEREVFLSGEAFFNVAHDPEHPFVITTSKVQVEVLGTTFNLSSYPGQNTSVINVTSGKVKFSDTKRKEKVVLTAGTSCSYLEKEEKMVVARNLQVNYDSWLTQMISFHRVPLREVFAEIENVYHVKIICRDPRIGELLCTANFAHNSIQYVLDIIAQTHNLSIEQTSEGVIIKPRQ